MNQDREHLKWLSIGFYVFAGLVALFSSVFLIYIVMGLAMVTGAFPDDGKGTPPPPAFGWLFVGIGAAIVLIGWGFAAAFVIAGKSLKANKRYIFCIVMAALACTSVPFGTVLGVFTIIVLMRDSVKTLFNGNLSAPPANQSFDPPNWR